MLMNQLTIYLEINLKLYAIIFLWQLAYTNTYLFALYCFVKVDNVL